MLYSYNEIPYPFKVMNYYVGKGICSGFSITCYGKIWAKFMANPIDNVICTNMERYGWIIFFCRIEGLAPHLWLILYDYV